MQNKGDGSYARGNSFANGPGDDRWMRSHWEYAIWCNATPNTWQMP